MWIGIVFIVMVAGYLVWSLIKGKMMLTMAFYFHPHTRVIDRATSPKTFWALWSITAAALVVFTFFFVRSVSG